MRCKALRAFALALALTPAGAPASALTEPELKALEASLLDGQVVELTSDLTLPRPMTIKGRRNLTLKGNVRVFGAGARAFIVEDSVATTIAFREIRNEQGGGIALIRAGSTSIVGLYGRQQDQRRGRRHLRDRGDWSLDITAPCQLPRAEPYGHPPRAVEHCVDQRIF
jgi:hypothetical protein